MRIGSNIRSAWCNILKMLNSIICKNYVFPENCAASKYLCYIFAKTDIFQFQFSSNILAGWKYSSTKISSQIIGEIWSFYGHKAIKNDCTSQNCCVILIYSVFHCTSPLHSNHCQCATSSVSTLHIVVNILKLFSYAEWSGDNRIFQHPVVRKRNIFCAQ